MSRSDNIFADMCDNILLHGHSSTGEVIRAKWPDGTPAHTIKRFGVVNRYNLAEEFPILTLRPTNLRGVVNELLWMWRDKSNVVADLDSKIWDAWKLPDGTIGASYGAQLGKVHKYADGNFDQVDRLLYDLYNNPYSRRMIVNMYNHDDLHLMPMYPCAFAIMFNVTGKKLNATLIQRSNDILVANNWDLVQYAVLLHMLAGVNDLEVGELVHVINDAHIYDRHIDAVNKIIVRTPNTAPIFKMKKRANFYHYTVDDFSLENYNPWPNVKFEVAL